MVEIGEEESVDKIGFPSSILRRDDMEEGNEKEIERLSISDDEDDDAIRTVIYSTASNVTICII